MHASVAIHIIHITSETGSSNDISIVFINIIKMKLIKYMMSIRIINKSIIISLDDFLY